MALDYQLLAATKSDPYQFVTSLFKQAGIEFVVTSHKDDVIRGISPGLRVVARLEVYDDPDYYNALSIFPTVRTGLILGRSIEEKEIGDLTIFRVTLERVRRTDEDLLLLFNGELPILLRKANKLFLSENNEFWTPSLLELVRMPYERVHMPVL